jgi:TonB family protein
MILRSNVCILLVLSAVSVWPQSPSSQSTPPDSPTELVICNATSAVLGRPVTEVAPGYPKRELKAKIQGDVALDLTVSEKGKVVTVSVLSGDTELSREAAKAVRKWEYFPDADNPAERHARVTFIFKIDGGKPVIGAEFPSPPNPSFCSGDPSVTAPRPVYFPDPSYSEEARRARVQEDLCFKPGC